VAAAKVVIFAACDECDGNDPRWMSSEAARASTNFAFSTAVALSASGRERKMNFVGILLAFAGRSMLVSGTSLWFLPETVFTIKSPIWNHHQFLRIDEIVRVRILRNLFDPDRSTSVRPLDRTGCYVSSFYARHLAVAEIRFIFFQRAPRNV
jgi:hypothetical protein